MKITQAQEGKQVRNTKTGEIGTMGPIHTPDPIVSVKYPKLGLLYNNIEDLEYANDKYLDDFSSKLEVDSIVK